MSSLGTRRLGSLEDKSFCRSRGRGRGRGQGQGQGQCRVSCLRTQSCEVCVTPASGSMIPQDFEVCRLGAPAPACVLMFLALSRVHHSACKAGTLGPASPRVCYSWTGGVASEKRIVPTIGELIFGEEGGGHADGIHESAPTSLSSNLVWIRRMERSTTPFRSEHRDPARNRAMPVWRTGHHLCMRVHIYKLVSAKITPTIEQGNYLVLVPHVPSRPP